MVMNTAWLSYAWKDNEGVNQGTIDFIVQELERQGISVRFDRSDLIAGLPLWPQIEEHISSPALCDAWVYVVTAASLESRPCREELLYALDRALDKRKATFPMIGLVVGAMAADLPKALAVRLCVSTNEANWAEQVAAGVRGERPPAGPAEVHPFVLHFCTLSCGNADHVFEVHPRLGAWAPFCFGLAEADAHKYEWATYAPSSGEQCVDGHLAASMTSPLDDWKKDGLIWRGVRTPAVTSTMGAHLFLRLGSAPLAIHFGQRGGPIYSGTLTP